MSTSSAIKIVEYELKKLLGAIKKEEYKEYREKLWAGISPIPDFEFKPPHKSNTNRVYIFLYQILENVHLKNEEPQRINYLQLQPPSLNLDLYYLIVLYGDNKNEILGRIMQIFHDHARLILTNGNGVEEEVRILLNPLSLDDLTKIWGTFKDEFFTLSVSYMVTPVRIESAVPMDITPVMAKRMEYYIKKRNDDDS